MRTAKASSLSNTGLPGQALTRRALLLPSHAQRRRPISNHLVRSLLAAVAQRGVSSATVHADARALWLLVRFAYEEGWIGEPVKVPMPKLEQKRLEVDGGRVGSCRSSGYQLWARRSGRR